MQHSFSLTSLAGSLQHKISKHHTFITKWKCFKNLILTRDVSTYCHFHHKIVSACLSVTLCLFNFFVHCSCFPVMFWLDCNISPKPHKKQHLIDWCLFIPFGALPVSTSLVSVRYFDKSPRHMPWFCLIWPCRAFLAFYQKISGIFGLSP